MSLEDLEKKSLKQRWESDLKLGDMPFKSYTLWAGSEINSYYALPKGYEFPCYAAGRDAKLRVQKTAEILAK